MRPITDALKDGAWSGRRAFVVGSGPSTRGVDFARELEGELSIGCNEEFRWNPTIAIGRDVRWLKERLASDEFKACRSLKVYAKPHPHVTEPFAIPDEIHLLGTTTVRKTFAWGTSLAGGVAGASHCGIAALNLADILGADPIYLLGFDCRADENRRTHGHDRYPKEWGTNPRRFKRWIDDFIWASKRVRAKVYNVPTSAVECFEKVDAIPLGVNAEGRPSRLMFFPSRPQEVRLGDA